MSKVTRFKKAGIRRKAAVPVEAFRMWNDNIRRILDAQERLSRQLESIHRVTEATSRIQDVLQQQQELLRVGLGPLEDIRRSGHMDLVSQLHHDTSGLTSLLEAEQRFLLPTILDVTKLFDEYVNRIELNSFTPHSQQVSQLQGLMESMRTPWLDVASQSESVNAFASLHNMGSLLRTVPPFDTELTGILRLDLGDWREEITWPTDIATDPFKRASFYLRQGFNAELTTFPYPAFEEIVTEAGLRVPDLPVAEEYDLERESDETEREVAFERTNNAHDLLQRFESQLRRFINEQMEAEFGPGWTKSRIPGDMNSQWLDKQQQDTGTQKWPLIAYADFTDYVKIIARNDNWRDLFQATFGNKASVQESFRRLYPIRLATMHARLITQDDELYLYVETKRILSAIETDM